MIAGIVRRFDRYYRRRVGIKNFCTKPECIFRIATVVSPSRFTLPSGVVIERGALLGKLHFFNEHLVSLHSLDSKILAARQSLRYLAYALQHDEELQTLVAVGATYFMPRPKTLIRIVKGLGFEVVLDKACPFTGGWVNQLRASAYTLLLRKAFVPHSGATTFWCYPVSMWMSTDTLKERYGQKIVPVCSASHAA